MNSANQVLLENIKTKTLNSGVMSSDFDLNLDSSDQVSQKLTPAAVLIAIKEIDESLHILLTKRSSNLKNHPSQISFPGGKRDTGDVSLEITALREANEEIGLSPELVTFIGSLPNHKTVTGFDVKPYLGFINSPFKATINKFEVEELFTVPLNHLLNLENFYIESRKWKNKNRFYYTIPYGPYYIWGATARIIRSLAEIIAK